MTVGIPPAHAIGIGAQKAASSWVHDLLALHDRVSVPAAKEIDFFSYHHDRGHRWYRDRFAGDGLRFENSPSYLHDPRSPERAHQFDKGLKIVATLRDPVERAYSHHLHEVAKGHIPVCGFAEALAHNPDYLAQGFYAQHLTRWQRFFPKRQILILLAEDIRTNPTITATQLFDFLELPPGPTLTENRNVSDRARVALMRTVLRRGGAVLRRAGQEEFLLRLKAVPGIRSALAWNSQHLRNVVPPMTPEQRDTLSDVFADDMMQVSTLLDRPHLPWPSFERIAGRAALDRTA